MFLTPRCLKSVFSPLVLSFNSTLFSPFLYTLTYFLYRGCRYSGFRIFMDDNVQLAFISHPKLKGPYIAWHSVVNSSDAILHKVVGGKGVETFKQTNVVVLQEKNEVSPLAPTCRKLGNLERNLLIWTLMKRITECCKIVDFSFWVLVNVRISSICTLVRRVFAQTVIENWVSKLSSVPMTS